MKITFTFCFLLFSIILAYAQQTVKRTNQLSPFIEEQFWVLKADKKIRQGDYIAITPKKVVVAKGIYQNGSRVGIWDFFDEKKNHVQSFDYDKNEITFQDPEDLKKQRYFLKDVTKADSVNIPIKIGGSYYGFTMLLNTIPLLRHMVTDFRTQGSFNYTEVLTISETGAVVMHQAVANIANSSKIYRVAAETVAPEYTLFKPALNNGIPVACVIVTAPVPVDMPRITLH